MFREGKKIGIMKSYIRYSFVRLLPSFKTPLKMAHEQKSNHLLPLRPLFTFTLQKKLGFGCLIVKSEANCILN
jgi:hypothetical protein